MIFKFLELLLLQMPTSCENFIQGIQNKNKFNTNEILNDWMSRSQEAWEAIKYKYLYALILIAPKWDMEFHIHTNTSNLVVKVMLVQNPIGKCY